MNPPRTLTLIFLHFIRLLISLILFDSTDTLSCTWIYLPKIYTDNKKHSGAFLCESILDKMQSYGVTDESRHAEYSYALFVLFLDTLCLGVLILTGYLFGILSEALVFFFAFRCLRRYAGGYHAKSAFLCFVLSFFAIVFSCFAISFLESLKDTKISTVIFFVSFVIILILTPVGEISPLITNRPRSFFKAVTVMIILLFSAVYFVSLGRGLPRIFIPISTAAALEALLLVTGFIFYLSKRFNSKTSSVN